MCGTQMKNYVMNNLILRFVEKLRVLIIIMIAIFLSPISSIEMVDESICSS